MEEYPSFHSESNYYGLEYFPYGIDRSGEFMIEHVNLLVSHGNAYKALADGSRLPVTLEESQFVDFCRGGRDAETGHERVWQLYCAKVGRRANVVPMTSYIDDGSYIDFEDEMHDLHI